MIIVGLSRRRRFCRSCGAVQVAEPGESCVECGAFALTANGEPWRRIRAKKNGELVR